MAKRTTEPRISQQEWLAELAEVRPEVAVAGFWDNLEVLCDGWAKEISVGPYWEEVKAHLKDWRYAYRTRTGGALLASPALPTFEGKKTSRILSKLHCERLHRDDYANFVFPDSGPPIPELRDLVRTRVMCKYIDGVRFFSDKLFGLAEEMRLSPKCVQEARPEGYFARHINFKSSVFYRIAGTETPGEVRCEVQVATELATRIWEATHPIYEAEREHEQASEEWQWDPKDPRFISRQLGHMIHLADGLILRLREASHPSETERKRK